MAEAAIALARLEEAGALRRTGLTIPGNISADEYEALGVALSAMRDSLQWAFGDWIVGGEAVFGEEVYQLQEAARVSERSRAQYARVATRIPETRRIPELSWSHHRSVMTLEPEDADRLLRAAAASGWSKERIEEEARELRTPQSELATGYVVEAVLDAAEAIWEAHGDPPLDPYYCVPAELIDNLGRALGKLD